MADAITTNAHTLIRRALQTLGKQAAGESVQAEHAADGLTTLNEMIDNWRTQNFIIYQLLRVTKVLTPSVGTYTIGVGGSIDTPRPIEIRGAAILDPSSPTYERAIAVMDEVAYSAWNLKAMTGALSNTLYYDPALGLPFGTIHLGPISTQAGTLVLYVLAGLAQFPDLTTDVVLPHGYFKALRYNLAVQLAPDYGIEPTRVVYDEARASLADIKRINIRHRVLVNDLSGRGVYNIRTDEFGR